MVPILLLCLSSIVFVDELTPSYPDAWNRTGALSWRSDTALGCPAGVHLLGIDGDGSPIRISLLDEQGEPVPEFRVARLHAVPVEENTGLDSRTEQFSGQMNPHVIRRAPFSIYEAIEPLTMTDGKVDGGDHGPSGFRLEVSSERAGRADYVVHVAVGDLVVERPWTVMTHDWRPGEDRAFGYTNWFSPTDMADRHGAPRWSEDHWKMLARYARLLHRGGQDTFWIRWQDFFDEREGVWTLEESRLRRYVMTFLEAGLTRLEGAPIASRPGGDWSSPVLELRLGGVPANSPEGRAILGPMIDSFAAAVNRGGWSDQWVQHLADEPTDVNAADYRTLAEFFRTRAPGVRIIEATMTRALAGAVDIWCPQVHEYQERIDFFDARRADGDEVWTYTCLVPGGPWLNRLLDQERLRSVYFGWAGARYAIDGFLHWGLNHYKADPFTQSVVDHPAMPGTTNKLPAGDTHVIYPGPDGPWSSTRFEAQRIGLEDLSALRELRRRDPAEAVGILDAVFRAYDDWEPSVREYRVARRRLLEAVSRPSP